MLMSPSIAVLTKALSAAQGEFETIGKDKTGKIRSEKASYDYKYADLATCLESTRKALAKYGVAVVQPVRTEGARAIVTTIVACAGEWISEETTINASDASPQKVGSAITYARRYGFLAMVGAAPDLEDDDGDHAGRDYDERPRQSRGGYSDPSAEMREEEDRRKAAAKQSSAQNLAPRTAATAADGPHIIDETRPHLSEAQFKLVWMLAKQHGVTPDDLKALVARVEGVPADKASTKVLTPPQADAVIAALKAWGKSSTTPPPTNGTPVTVEPPKPVPPPAGAKACQSCGGAGAPNDFGGCGECGVVSAQAPALATPKPAPRPSTPNDDDVPF